MARPGRIESVPMLSHLRRFVAALAVVLTLSLPFAAGQSDISVERGVKADPASSDKSSGSSSALPYFALVVYTLLVMTIVCMPSRKA